MLAIKCGKIIPVTAAPIQEGGVLLIEDGKIMKIGELGMEIPADAEILDASDKWVYPGFIEASCHIGANRQPNDFTNDFWDGDHDGVDTMSPMQPQLKIEDGINPADNTIKWVKSSGITTCFVAPGPSSLIDGQGIAIKIKDAETVDELLCGEESRQMCFTLGKEVLTAFKRKKQSPTTRMAAIEMLRDMLTQAIEYGKSENSDCPKDSKLEALLPVVRGEMTARFECLRADDMVAAVKLAEQFDLKYVLVGSFEAHCITNFLKNHRVPILAEAIPYGPERCMPMLDFYDFSLECAADIEKCKSLAGITVNENGQTRRLPMLTGFTTAYGLDPQAALEAITIRPAKLLGMENRIGSLEKGKDADISIFTGDALLNTSRCTCAMVEDRIIFKE